MTVIISLALSVAAGLMATRVFKLLGFDFPDVTAFLVSGVLIGPFVLGRLGVPGLGFATYDDVAALGLPEAVVEVEGGFNIVLMGGDDVPVVVELA